MTLQKILKLLASTNDDDVKVGNELLQAHPEYMIPVAALITCCGQSSGQQDDKVLDEILGISSDRLWYNGTNQDKVSLFSIENIPNLIKHVLENAK